MIESKPTRRADPPKSTIESNPKEPTHKQCIQKLALTPQIMSSDYKEYKPKEDLKPEPHQALEIKIEVTAPEEKPEPKSESKQTEQLPTETPGTEEQPAEKVK
jgi:hypothetical protein